MVITKRTAVASSKAKIFISYSRKDAAFADRLDEALQARDFHPLIDRTDIYLFEDWERRIQSLIVQADTIVSVLSPDYVLSDTCKNEVEFAASRNKRFAPIEYRPVDCKLVPAALERLNVEFFDISEQFEQKMDRLAEALRTDIDWIRRYTEFEAQAHDWVADGKPRGLLLRSPVLEEAERWIALRPRTAPMPNVEIQAFIAASRSATLRHRDFLAASLTVGLLVALGLAGLFYWQRSTAENATKLTKKALYTTEQLANKLVLKFGNDPRLFSLPPELREEIFDQAILSYNSVLKLDPMNAETYNDRGNAYFAKAEFEGAAAYDQAIADYGDAIALDPKNVRAYSNRCWIGVVVARQLQRALSDCDEALRIEPQYLNALDNRGFAYLKLERVDDAIKSFDAALKIDPKFPTSLYGRGLAKMKNGDRESAAVDMKAAIAIKSNVADVLARYSIKVSGPISAGNNGDAIVNNMIDSDNYSGTRN